MTLRTAVIRLALPLAWRLSRRRAVESLQRFSATELDSAWQSLHAMEAAGDPSLKARLFEHALEELGHAELFSQAAKALSSKLPAIPVSERTPLFKPRSGNGLVSFYALAHLGEDRVSREFEAYLAAAPYEEAREVFRAVLEDEKGHALSTARWLARAASSRQELRRELLKARLGRFRGSWLRFLRALGEIPSALILGLVYLLAGLLLGRACRGHLEGSREREAPAL